MNLKIKFNTGTKLHEVMLDWCIFRLRKSEMRRFRDRISSSVHEENQREIAKIKFVAGDRVKALHNERIRVKEYFPGGKAYTIKIFKIKAGSIFVVKAATKYKIGLNYFNIAAIDTKLPVSHFVKVK